MIDHLRTELAATEKEIAEADAKNAALAGGALKAFVEARLEILKISKALIEQRIHSVETGANTAVTVPITAPDAVLSARLREEIESEEWELDEAREDLKSYPGGLVMTIKASAIATQEQTVAMLKQRYLIAEYGLASPNIAQPEEPTATSQERFEKVGRASSTHDALAKSVLSVTVLNKRYAKQNYEDRLSLDIQFNATGLDAPARAIKGTLNLNDLFDETKMRINWTIDEPIEPGGELVEKRTGFTYNQFNDGHVWARNTDLDDMTATFTVKSIIYQDGTRQDLSP